jgi:PAS domain-containing protein
MELIFFIYGLAFFLMGFAVLNYPKKGSSFFLARKIHFVAWFGIIHGLNEWLDMFIMIDAMKLTFFLRIVRMMTLPLSFLCLVYFGSEVISSQNKKCRPCKFLAPGLLIIWAAVFFLGEYSELRWDVWSRYLLCFTGATLTGIALWMHVPEIENTENSKLTFNLKVAGSAFVIYGVLAGSIVPDGDFFPASVINYSLFATRLGVPVQIFRSVCAVVIAYHLIRALKIFQWETQQTLFNCEYRFKAVIDTAPVILFIADSKLKITFIEGRGMKSLQIKPSDILNRPISEAFSQVPLMQENARKALAGEEFTSMVSFDKSYFEVFFGPFRSSRGVIQGVTGIAVDVTEQKTSQAQMDNYRYEMEKNKTLAAIGALSTEITSDMVVPLHESKVSLLKASSGLGKTIGAEEVKINIKNGIERLTRAINKIDSFCDKANLKKPPYAQPIEVYQITQRILSVFQEMAQRAMMKISIEGADILPVMPISSRELEQIFYTMVQQLILSADGIHIHNLNIAFSIEETFLCMKFSEYSSHRSPADGENMPPAGTNVFPDKDKYNFELSVLKGITEAQGGTIRICPNSQGGFVYEIRIPIVA